MKDLIKHTMTELQVDKETATKFLMNKTSYPFVSENNIEEIKKIILKEKIYKQEVMLQGSMF